MLLPASMHEEGRVHVHLRSRRHLRLGRCSPRVCGACPIHSCCSSPCLRLRRPLLRALFSAGVCLLCCCSSAPGLLCPVLYSKFPHFENPPRGLATLCTIAQKPVPTEFRPAKRDGVCTESADWWRPLSPCFGSSTCFGRSDCCS